MPASTTPRYPFNSFIINFALAGQSLDAWKNVEGLERRRTPLSDHLYALFTEWGKRFLGLTQDFELMFDF